VSTYPDILEALLRPPSGDDAIDRKALASLLVEIAESLKPELRAERNGVTPRDLQLEQLRTLLVGREIETVWRLAGTVDDPERLAAAIGRILPTAIARATSDERMGHVLAPVMERAAESSIRSDPTTLVNILYPTIVPAIRKSIGESIDEMFQRVNQALKYSLTLRGLKWRWEAWRTGRPFAEVVLKHTLVYQVEHVFLVHRHTGLLIAHVAAENAVSQDPQLVSSMLVAIQDFVRDSFSGAEHQGVDSVQLGELRLWSEPGPFALLVAVIRGDPPEGLHDTLRDTLTRIHAERHHALESFNGDSEGLGDVEARLRDLVALGEHAPPRVGLARLVFWGLVLLLLILAGTWAAWWWHNQQLWQGYLERLRAQPGIVITEAGKRDGKFVVSGLRDPLAADPQAVLREAGVNPAWVVESWIPYQGLDPQSVLKRLDATLEPPPSVTLAIEGNRIVAQGSAPRAWLDRAHAVAQALPAGSPGFDLAGVRNEDEADEQKWQAYLKWLRSEPGIVITKSEARDGKFLVSGLRDPLAVDPLVLLVAMGIDPARVETHFEPYQGLDPQSMLKRLTVTLNPPPGVTLTIDGNRIVAQGSAPRAWLDRAHAVAEALPAGAPGFDLAGVRNEDEADEQQLQAYVDRLRAEPGIMISRAEARDGKLFLSGLRDPLAVDPLKLLTEAGIDPARVEAHFEPYEGLDPQFVLKRLQASLNPPPGMTFAIEGDRIVAQGSAPSPWISRARKVGSSLPAGAPVLDLSAVRDISEGALGKLRDVIQARSINFDSGKSLPAAGQEQVLDEIASELNELVKLSSTLHAVIRVTLTGHADSQGQGTSNLSLSVARAEAVRALLKKRGVDPDLLQVRGAGQLEPLADDTSAAAAAARSANRRVSFSIGFEEEP
jgi:outer membrane protein OmpA-like peptidoglycan-associated protein/vacuolar-type H+-ATPase subunit F/Vma7